jgi:hypothetical protein
MRQKTTEWVPKENYGLSWAERVAEAKRISPALARRGPLIAASRIGRAGLRLAKKGVLQAGKAGLNLGGKATTQAASVALLLPTIIVLQRVLERLTRSKKHKWPEFSVSPFEHFSPEAVVKYMAPRCQELSNEDLLQSYQEVSWAQQKMLGAQRVIGGALLAYLLGFLSAELLGRGVMPKRRLNLGSENYAFEQLLLPGIAKTARMSNLARRALSGGWRGAKGLWRGATKVAGHPLMWPALIGGTTIAGMRGSKGQGDKQEPVPVYLVNKRQNYQRRGVHLPQAPQARLRALASSQVAHGMAIKDVAREAEHQALRQVQEAKRDAILKARSRYISPSLKALMGASLIAAPVGVGLLARHERRKRYALPTFLDPAMQTSRGIIAKAMGARGVRRVGLVNTALRNVRDIETQRGALRAKKAFRRGLALGVGGAGTAVGGVLLARRKKADQEEHYVLPAFLAPLAAKLAPLGAKALKTVGTVADIGMMGSMISGMIPKRKPIQVPSQKPIGWQGDKMYPMTYQEVPRFKPRGFLRRHRLAGLAAVGAAGMAAGTQLSPESKTRRFLKKVREEALEDRLQESLQRLGEQSEMLSQTKERSLSYQGAGRIPFPLAQRLAAWWKTLGPSAKAAILASTAGTAFMGGRLVQRRKTRKDLRALGYQAPSAAQTREAAEVLGAAGRVLGEKARTSLGNLMQKKVKVGNVVASAAALLGARRLLRRKKEYSTLELGKLYKEDPEFAVLYAAERGIPRAVVEEAGQIRQMYDALTEWELGKVHGQEEASGERPSPGALHLAALKMRHGDAYLLGRQAALARAGKSIGKKVEEEAGLESWIIEALHKIDDLFSRGEATAQV